MGVVHRRFVVVPAACAVLCLSLCIVAPTTAVVNAAPPGAAAYVPVSPNRVLDTRIGLGFSRRLTGNEAFTLDLPGVPADAVAVVLNVTVVDTTDVGFVTIYPTGLVRPNASSINVDAPGQTIANLVTVPVGIGGDVDVFSQPATDLVADVQGYYQPAAAAQAGRFVPVNPTRLLDTRQPGSAHFGPLGPNSSLTLDVAGLAGLPGDAVAAALKVTVTESAASGFWTVFPADTTLPTASNLNIIGAGATIANQVLGRLSNGRTTIFTQSGGQLIVDLVGWFTGPSAASSDAGLFVPVSPTRLLDTRLAPFSGVLPAHYQTAEVSVENHAGLPATGVAAVVVNATITQASSPGFFSLWPARTYRPNASSLNATHASQTIANHVITPISTFGFAFYTQTGAHLVIDITGWYSGSETPAVLPPHVPLTTIAGPSPSSSFVLQRLTNGAIPRWNACHTISYAVSPGNYTSPALRSMIDEAVQRLAAATGLTMGAVADTTYVPTGADQTLTGVPSGELVIALSDSAHTDLVPGDIVGRSGIVTLGNAIVKASVVVDMGDVGGRAEWAGAGPGPVLLHEIAHAVGLDHVNDPAQLMNPVTSPTGPTTYGSGDLNGLWQLGVAAGCG